MLVRGKLSNRLNFTKRSLDALPLPTEGFDTYADTDTRGLQLRVFTSGAKTFVLYRKINGRGERVKIGRYPDVTVEQARAEALRLNNAVARGVNPAKERRSIRDEMTFDELFAIYLEEHAKKHKRTWKSDVDTNRLYLSRFKLFKISAISRMDVTRLHTQITRDSGPYAANRTLALLSVIFNFARDNGWPGANPVVGVKRNDEDKRERFLDADELPKFWRALAAEEDITMRDYILSALLTGARSRKNLLSMRWDEIRWSRGVWEIPAAKAKKKKPMTIVLIPLMMALLRKRQAEVGDSEWVFPGRKGRTTAGHIVEPKMAWERVRDRAGLKDARLHDLRRTLGSWQAMLGTSLTIIGASLGHDSLEATKVYARLNLDPVRASVERATSAMLEVEFPKGLLPESTES